MSFFFHILTKPAEEIWIEQQIAKNHQEWLEHEMELDLQRELELNPYEELDDPSEIIDGVVLSSWSSYQSLIHQREAEEARRVYKVYDEEMLGAKE